MITLTYLGHSAFLVKYNNQSFVIDPYQDNSVPGMKFPRVSANYVFSSHNHYDHNAVDLVKIEPTNEEFDYDTMYTRPLYSLLSQYDIDRLYNIATSIRYAGNAVETRCYT